MTEIERGANLEPEAAGTSEPATPRHLDGNALAGWLREIFAIDMTAADAPCAACGRVWVMAELHVYAAPQAPGLVARCPGCEAVVLRVVRGPSAAWLDLRGAALLRIPLPPEVPSRP